MKKIRITVCLLMLLLNAANSQTSLNSSYFQTLTARALGPSTMSGRISAIEGIVTNDQLNLYVGTAGGGVWKSQNGGISFSPVFDKYCQSIGAIAIDKNNPRTVYVGTGESNMRNSVSIGEGLYKTNDGGANWQKIGLDSTEHISKVLIDPNDAKTIFVAAPGPLWHNSANRGLYKSTDGGKTWKKALYVNEETGCADIAIHPTNSNIILASFWQFRRKPFAFESGGPGSGLFKSTDGGETWTKISKGLPEGNLGMIVLTINPSKPSEILSIVEAKVPGLYLSKDQGDSWEKLAATENITARPFYFSTLVFDPKDPKRVYRPAFDFEYSKDGGFSWTNTIIGGVAPHADHHALWINPANTDQMFLGTDGGVYISQNKGVSWQFLNNLPVGQFYHVSTDNQPVYHVYGGLQDNGSWMAANSSAGGVSSASWFDLNGGDGFWVQPSPLNPQIVFAESQGGNANRIDLKTGLASSIKPQKQAGDEEHRFNWNTPIVTGLSAKKTASGKPVFNLYMANQYLYQSKDEGRSWTKLSPDLTTNDKAKQKSEESGGITGDNTSAENHCTIFTITQHPFNEQQIWVGTDDGNLQVTQDGGKTWTNKAPEVWKVGIPKGTWVSSIEISSLNPKRIYATFDNHMYGDHQTYLAISLDGGNTWKKIVSSEFTGFAHVIREDLQNEQLLFLGTETGLFFSLDGGKSFMRSKYQGMPWFNLVRDIKIHPKTGDLIIASHGRGIYVIDDLQPLRDLAKNNIEKDHLFFKPVDFVYDFGPQVPSIGGNIAGWTEAGKTLMPSFDYYLKQKSNDIVKIEIYDASGKKVKDLNGSNNKGLNKVYWPLNSNPPKVAKGGFVAQSTVFYSGIVGPKVPTGKYKILLKVDGASYEQTVTLLPNEAKGFSASNLAKLHEQSNRLIRLHESLAILVDSLDKSLQAWQKMANPSAEQIRKTARLDSLRHEILELKRQTIFYDELKFRRKVSDLYMEIATAFEPLSPAKEVAIGLLEKEFLDFKQQVMALIK